MFCPPYIFYLDHAGIHSGYYNPNVTDAHKLSVDIELLASFINSTPIANVTGGVAIGVEQIDDIVDIIKVMGAKDAGKIDELEAEELKLTSRPEPAFKLLLC